MPNLIPRDRGWLEVITGPMFSGKSGELIRRLTLAKIAKQEVIAFKPSIDNRFSETHIVSREGSKIECYTIGTPKFADNVLRMSEDKNVVGFDEAQFFPGSIVEVVDEMVLANKRVIVAGLELDYLREPFNSIPRLMTIADYVDKLRAVCVKCGNPAVFTYRKIVSDAGQVLVGDEEAYEARCLKCYFEGFRYMSEEEK